MLIILELLSLDFYHLNVAEKIPFHIIQRK